ncbi:MAG TPA: alkaline phosphatase family protein [Steroidobacteraceae bacterium]|nr:alkaline phosphatase family protein [Steroidobacteraceae bacterium]
MSTSLRKLPAFLGAAAMLANLSAPAMAFGFPFQPPPGETATPIKHLVVIYDENVSFDHYFGTYPHASNLSGEPPFYPAPYTPKVNNLSEALLTNNPNFTNPANAAGASNPFRLDRSQAATEDQDHNYTPEQLAFDHGAMDLFPEYTGTGTSGGAGAFGTTGQVMGYYDGNTVTALWNYAQHFAMSDDAYGSSFGPSTPGALEAVSGQTDGFTAEGTGSLKTSAFIPDSQGGYTDIGDIDPAFDVCTLGPNTGSDQYGTGDNTTEMMQMAGKNIGDLLNARNISWGAFMGGFDLSVTNANGSTACDRTTKSNVTGVTEQDYIPHHAWFQYYPSTANPTHARPSSIWAIGHTKDANGQPDPANHEYDVNDFFAAVAAGNFPAVAYLKAPGYQDGHAGYSDPLDEQTWIVQVVNFIEKQPEWKNTAIIIDWDDSDGWYDHSFVTPTNPSYSDQLLSVTANGTTVTKTSVAADELTASSDCGTGIPLDGLNGQAVYGRCGPGPRLPFMVISPYAKPNYVSHTLITQSSIIRFIEDNWLHGERLGDGSFDATAGSIMDMFDFNTRFLDPPLFLDEDTGEPVDHPGPFPVLAFDGR